MEANGPGELYTLNTGPREGTDICLLWYAVYLIKFSIV